MRISDWSSDVCSSDLACVRHDDRSPQGSVPTEHRHFLWTNGGKEALLSGRPARVPDSLSEKSTPHGNRDDAQFRPDPPTSGATVLRVPPPASPKSEERRVGNEGSSTGIQRGVAHQ